MKFKLPRGYVWHKRPRIIGTKGLILPGEQFGAYTNKGKISGYCQSVRGNILRYKTKDWRDGTIPVQSLVNGYILNQQTRQAYEVVEL